MTNNENKIDIWNNPRTILLMFFIVIAFCILIALTLKLFNPESKNDGLSNISMVLTSSTVALIGVAITGYIFSSESLRKLSDDDYKYKHCADEHKRDILKLVINLFAMACGVILTFFILIYIDYWKTILEIIIIFIFFLFLILSIILYVKMMNTDKGLKESAKKLLRSNITTMSDNPILHLNPLEYKSLVIDKGLLGRPDFITAPDDYGVENNLIKAIRGKESDHYKNTSDKNDIIGYRDMVDEFDYETTLTVFECTERILCRIAGTTTESIHKDEKMKLEAALDVGTGRREDIGMLNDIVQNYYMLSEFRDNLFVYYSDSEQSLTDPARVDRTAIPPFDDRYCCNRMGFFDTKNVGSDLQPIEKKKAEEELRYSDYLRFMTPYVFVLRYALCKKLNGVDMTAMKLSGYDFSYGDLKKSLFNGSMLMNASFYCCNLQGAELNDCDLTNASFNKSDCCDASLSRSKLSKIAFTDADLRGTRFDDSIISGCDFPSTLSSGSSFKNSSMVNCALDGGDFSNSDMAKCGFVNTRIANCLFKNSILSNTKISNCGIRNTEYHGCDFTESTINYSSIDDTSFILSKFDNLEMTSSIIIRGNFTNCQIINCDFHGSQFFRCSFNSAQVSNCDFTRALILPHNAPTAKINQLTDQILKSIRNENTDNNTIGNNNDLKWMNDFTNAFMKTSLFTDAIIKCSNFSFAILQMSIFSHSVVDKCVMDYSFFSGSYIADSKFCDVSLKDTSLDKSNITSCDLEKCALNGSSLNDTVIIKTTLNQCSLDKCSMERTKIIDTTWIECNMTPILFNEEPNCYFKGITLKGHGNYVIINGKKYNLLDGNYIDATDVKHRNDIK